MADENFEDDLFADLYDDNDASKTGPGPAPPAPIADHTAAPAAKDEPSHAPADQGADQQMGHTQDDEEEEDDEDDVDFNLGGGSTGGAMASVGGDMNTHQGSGSGYDDRAQSPPYGSVHRASAKDEGKMFIGGLNWETTDQSLRDYFSQFGEVVECTVMRDSNSGRSRGFGFLTFKDAKTVNVVMVKEHFLDGKIIDPKRAIPRDEQEKTSKIFVGGVSQDTTDQEFRDYFAQFGRVVDATLMMDKDTGRPRGFGFVTFESEAGVDACINIPLEIHGKPVEVKRAQPRGNLREEEEAQRRNRFKKDEQGAQGGAGGMGQQMGGSGMSPQVMAQYFQRMQQYFAMMQGQMAMNRGMQMNPQMMQQMQMQQMQQMQQMMGRGGQGQGGQNMMNPQMMQQMQQQMMQQQQQGGAGGGGGQGGFDGGNGGFEGNYDQSFQQQPPTGPQGGSHGGGHGRRGRGGYGGGRGGYNNNMGGGGQGGAPTSWEGMYDDVPQPNAGDGPSKAPVGAPTGPKRMNQPGANYRGGGRGGHRGFHPYGR
ncbi:RNA recognition motif domain-containing protein [Sarocladium implicatum]|nr:RNA recognition motif domain-containing protein [Sarocladium implicatum]